MTTHVLIHIKKVRVNSKSNFSAIFDETQRKPCLLEIIFKMLTRGQTGDIQDDVQHHHLDLKRKSKAVGSEIHDLESSKVYFF